MRSCSGCGRARSSRTRCWYIDCRIITGMSVSRRHFDTFCFLCKVQSSMHGPRAARHREQSRDVNSPSTPLSTVLTRKICITNRDTMTFTRPLETQHIPGCSHARSVPAPGSSRAQVDRKQCRPVRDLSTRAGSNGSVAVADKLQSYTGKGISGPDVGHHFLHIDDFSKDELWAMLQTSIKVKEQLKSGDNSYKPFAGKTMAMIFTKPSMRTRVSFETVSPVLAVSRPENSNDRGSAGVKQPRSPVCLRLKACLHACPVPEGNLT